MDARNGKILWSIADPSNALAFGPVTLANGVLLAGSTHGKGPIYAMNAKREKFCGSTTLEEWRTCRSSLAFNNTGFVLSVNSTVSRSTPTIAGDLLLAVVIVVKRSNGNLVWSTKLDDHARGFITMSGTYYKG
ncbi:hypothetical protein Q3G72_002461 [Acer saccharum]|nr:hypothetical protein Q3G72_002461 [Acer saccharum]